MLRSLVLLPCLAWPVTSSTDAGARDPLTPLHESAYAAAERLGPLIERRFALYAAMAGCNHSDDQYAFNLALAKFDASERFILRKAAYAGWQRGAAAADDAPCGAALDRLRAADDALLAQAELLPAP